MRTLEDVWIAPRWMLRVRDAMPSGFLRFSGAESINQDTRSFYTEARLVQVVASVNMHSLTGRPGYSGVPYCLSFSSLSSTIGVMYLPIVVIAELNGEKYGPTILKSHILSVSFIVGG